MKYTLDTNCIIDLEENRPDSIYLKKLIFRKRNKEIELMVVAISASENQPGGRESNNFDEFLLKLEAANLQDVEIILPMAYWDVAFWDKAIWADAPGAEELEVKIHNILFPGTPIEKPKIADYSEKKWRNNKSDVQIAWSHIYHGQDILVTRDENFHKNADALRSIGLKKIIRPKEIQL